MVIKQLKYDMYLVVLLIVVMLRRVIVEHARGTPRGEDLRRDLDRGYSISRRSGGGGGGGGGTRDRFVGFTRISHIYHLTHTHTHTLLGFCLPVHFPQLLEVRLVTESNLVGNCYCSSSTG